MADQVVIKIGANASGAIAAFGLVAGAAQAMANRVIGFGLNMARRFTMAVPDALKSADAMYKSAQSAGLGVETFSALAHAADLAGASVSDLVIASRNAAKQGMTLDVALMKTADEFESMTSETAKLNLARERFGKGSQALIPLLNSGSKAIREQMEEAKRLGLVISEEFGASAEKFNDSLTKMLGAVKGIANSVANELLPSLQAVADIMNREAQKPRDSGGWWQSVKQGSAIAALGDILQSKAIDDPYGPITESQQSAFDARLRARRKRSAIGDGGEDEGPVVKADKITIKVPESRASSAFTSRGFLSQGEAQMVSRTASFQKNVQSTLAEILGLQRQYLPKMAESLS